jgi:hypothetical protein
MRARLGMKGWLGLAALGALQYLGPRPAFVKTAYAEAPAATTPATVVTTVDGGALPSAELPAEAPAPAGTRT